MVESETTKERYQKKGKQYISTNIKDVHQDSSSIIEKIRMKYNKTPIKADIYNPVQLKLTLDDLVVELVSSMGYKPNNFYVDAQNIIGIISTIITAIVAYLSVYYKFDEISKYLTVLIPAYFLLSGISYLNYFAFGGLLRFNDLSLRSKLSKSVIYEVLVVKKDTSNKYFKSILDLYHDTGILDHNLFIDGIIEFINEIKF